MTIPSDRPVRRAFRGVQPKSTTGLPAREEFYTQHVPELWVQLVAVFGQLVFYHYIEGDSTGPIQVIVNEGIEGEPRSPGRYSRLLLRNADLVRLPLAGDWLELQSLIYDVVSVDAALVDISRLIIQLTERS